MGLTWGELELLGLTWGELDSLKLTWGDIEAISFGELLILVNARVERFKSAETASSLPADASRRIEVIYEKICDDIPEIKSEIKPKRNLWTRDLLISIIGILLSIAINAALPDPQKAAVIESLCRLTDITEQLIDVERQRIEKLEKLLDAEQKNNKSLEKLIEQNSVADDEPDTGANNEAAYTS